MDITFCVHYRGDALPPTNRFCRDCPIAKTACDSLWSLVVALSRSGGGEAVPLPGTHAVMYPNPRTWDIVHLKINTRWGLPKEDFLHFIATGSAQMGRKGERLDTRASPSMTRQEPYVQAIVAALGGEGIPEIQAVRVVQANKQAFLSRTAGSVRQIRE
ncbi:hypothetical protein [Methanoregula sp.]|uniref:hypothetical protein n=1 Tax=Methanoregula sp. TaxID=2052170 RepID=UPI000CB23C1C|nr:hypothetical protein [Methanoregula sp.]PKG32482.1 MAG: hypothetical protein CW742_07945 [Methanoregula sp.]